ncbi:MAG: NAD-dependent protein deacylase [Huintestinicola sp.]
MAITDATKTLREWVAGSDNIVFFGGAGVSTESGIPDFRSVDGLYNMKYKYPPETILSHQFFCYHVGEFYEFYKDKMLYLDIKPNKAHLALAELERQGKLKAVVTQNIDGLHQAAGSRTVYELHGSVHRNYCVRCGEFHDAEYVKNSPFIPECSKCGGLIKPDVVLYQEGLNQQIVNASIEAIENCDMLIIGGTSLSVYPASGLIDYYHGNKLVLINKSATTFDERADLLINDSVGEALDYCVSHEE